jgi:hypothetical protein
MPKLSDIDERWNHWLATERGGDQRAPLDSLTVFVNTLRAGPEGERVEWVADLCRLVLDQHEAIPPRRPLFVGQLVGFLKVGFANGERPVLPWLDAVTPHLFSNRFVWREFNFFTERAFLERALEHAPSNVCAKGCLSASSGTNSASPHTRSLQGFSTAPTVQRSTSAQRC